MKVLSLPKYQHVFLFIGRITVANNPLFTTSAGRKDDYAVGIAKLLLVD